MYILNMENKNQIIINNRNKLLRNFFTEKQIELINRALSGDLPKSQTSDYVRLSRIKQKLKAMNNIIGDSKLFKLLEKK